jgi:hypothetical protein
MKKNEIASHIDNLYELAMVFKLEAEELGLDILSIRSMFSMGFVSVCFQLNLPPSEMDYYLKLVAVNYRKNYRKSKKDLENKEECVTNKVKKKAEKKPRKSKT